MNETAVSKERAVLAGLSALSMEVRERSSDVSMEELASLVETAGGEPVAVIMQNLPSPNTHSFIGEGKVREMKDLIEANDCDLAVFDNELTPSQMRVLGEELGVKVLDRSGLILDIFAQRAQTREGQLQVNICFHASPVCGRTLSARRLPAALPQSVHAVLVKHSWKLTAGIFAARFRSWRKSLPK